MIYPNLSTFFLVHRQDRLHPNDMAPTTVDPTRRQRQQTTRDRPVLVVKAIQEPVDS